MSVNAAAGRYLFVDRWPGKILSVNAAAGAILSLFFSPFKKTENTTTILSLVGEMLQF